MTTRRQHIYAATALSFAIAACTATRPAVVPLRMVLPPDAAAHSATSGSSADTPQVPAPAPAMVKRAAPVPPNPEIVAKGKQLAKQGLESYRDGDYDRAESLLKEAIAVYPFLADANLTLGRIFLIRGSATRDRAMITSARTMFEMARAMDPNLREAQVLLDLFREAPPE